MSVVYGELTSEAYEEMLNGLAKAFQVEEAMGKHLMLDETDFETLKELFKSCLNDSVCTLAAKDGATNEVVGALICMDLYKIINEESTLVFSKRLAAILDLLAKLENDFVKRHGGQIFENEYFYQYVVYVKNNTGHKGIATQLYKMSEEFARQKNYKFMISIATGGGSQHVIQNKCNYLLVDQLEYSKYEFEGEHVFEGIDTKYCKVLLKQVNQTNSDNS